MPRLLVALFTLVLIAQPATAQVRAHLEAATPAGKTGPAAPAIDDEPRPIHVTDLLDATPEARQALEDFHALKASGQAAGKTAEVYTIGETRNFKVCNFSGGSCATSDQIEFTLKADEERFLIWVETAEVTNGHVRDQDIEELRVRFAERTPPGSINADAGIIINNESIFGNPPVVAGNTKVDVLLVDIRDTYSPPSSLNYIAGFVTSSDLSGGTGNQRPIVYVDTHPGLFRNGSHLSTAGIEATLAHEYQHLIHYNYQLNEETFVNEGLSVWAEAMNGYANQLRYNYLGNAAEHNVRLFDWRTGQPSVLNDYDRAGLFTTYIAQRIGPQATGSIVQAMIQDITGPRPATGAAGYEVVLGNNGLALESFVADFHTANLINDLGLGANYGYSIPELGTLRAAPSQSFAGTAASSTNLTDFTMNSGGVRYLTWTDVGDFSVHADVFSQLAESLKPGVRTRIRLRLLLEHAGGAAEVVDMEPAIDRTFSGDFKRVTLAVMHVAPGRAEARFEVTASWEPSGGSGIRTERIAYDGGKATPMSFQNARFLLMGAGALQASRFVVPAEGRLSKILVAPIYENQFSNSEVPAGAPRDFRVHVFASDGTGYPGEELYVATITESSSASHINFSTYDYSFFEHALPPENLNATLPDTIFVGFSNVGSDANYVVLTTSAYDVENVSFLNLPQFGPNNSGGWAAFSDIYITENEEPNHFLRDRALPIRAEFLVQTSTASEALDELPAVVTLEQNYPNPFNPSTAIRYALPQAGQVRLAVYDLLGREVAVLVDGPQTAGAHEFRLDASTWASGVYLYVLRAGGRQETGRMMLIK